MLRSYEQREPVRGASATTVSNVLYFVGATGLFFLVMVIGLSRGVVRSVLQLTAATETLKNEEFDKAKIKLDGAGISMRPASCRAPST